MPLNYYYFFFLEKKEFYIHRNFSHERVAKLSFGKLCYANFSLANFDNRLHDQ